jgi:hypothetical protein
MMNEEEKRHTHTKKQRRKKDPDFWLVEWVNDQSSVFGRFFYASTIYYHNMVLSLTILSERVERIPYICTLPYHTLGVLLTRT